MAAGKTPQELSLATLPQEALSGTIPLIGDALALRLLQALVEGPVRFSRLQVGASTKTVSAKLKELERHGLVTRTLYAQVPPRVDYALTAKGGELLSIVDGIAQWERSWRSQGQ